MDGKEQQCRTLDEWIEASPKDGEGIPQTLRLTIRKAAPEAVETISYQMPTFKLSGKGLVYYAAFKNHIGLYPIPSGIEAFKKELSRYKQGKGSVQFPIDKPIPYDLVRRIVRFRAKENQERKR